MAKSALTKGLVTGKSSGPLAGGMTVNPTIDTTNTQRLAARLLNIHQTAGVKGIPPKSGANQMGNRANGRKLTGGARVRGGRA